jgi:proteasome lid subunit RPN8/RPN11
VARRIGRGVIVTIFPDGGTRYLSEPFWDEGRRQMPEIRLSAEAHEAVRDHARNTYPDECCGALIGTGDEITGVMPLPNMTEEGPRRRFLVRPSDYRAAEAAASRRNAALLGFYHSHPDHSSRPSQYDLDHAWPSFTYVIVSVSGGEPGEITAWRLKDDRSGFEERRVVSADAKG